MLEIKGIFKCIEIKEVGDKKVLKLSNGDKDQNGNFINTYYDIWVTDKVSSLVSPELKKQITKCMLNISGWLKIVKTDKYTNLIIYPTEIKKHEKEK